jgi:endoglucanase
MPRRALALATALAAVLALAGPARAGDQRHNPFRGAKLAVIPDSDAARQAALWRSSRPRDARELQKIAREPWAEWLGDWLPDVADHVRWFTRTYLQPQRATGFFAVYDLPRRDCSGGYSRGGAPSAAAYRAWIDQVAGAIGSYPAVVVVEPDGLADSPCLGRAGQAQRLGLIAYATRTLAALPNTSVYIDAGRSDWLAAGTATSLLRRAGVAAARGFALDTTGYATTRNEVAYGRRIGLALGGKHFIVNTSRNGRGPLPASQIHKPVDVWCNQWGRALGPRPTWHTASRLADAYEWILHPGYSDGYCNGGGKAGSWWPRYALGLAERAAY